MLPVAGADFPRSHFVHEDWPSELIFPGAQNPQVDVPGDDADLPGRHDPHVVAPADGAYFPGTQSVQVGAPSAL